MLIWYIKDSTSIDREEIDVYVNEDNLASDKVYKITQMKDPAEGKGTWVDFDEWKFMIGFDSKKQAGDVYKKCTSVKHFGGIVEIDLEDFIKMVKKNIARNKTKGNNT